MAQHRKITAFRSAIKAHFLDYARKRRDARKPEPSEQYSTTIPIGTVDNSVELVCCPGSKLHHPDTSNAVELLPAALEGGGFPGLQVYLAQDVGTPISGDTIYLNFLFVAPAGMDPLKAMEKAYATEAWWVEYTTEELEQGTAGSTS